MTTQIYIVEDHPLMRQVLCESVEKMPGLSVSGTAASAEEALTMLDGREVDLVLIDMSLPQMSGAELVGALQKRRPELPCLIVSGHRESIYVRQALLAGARGYVIKGDPYEIEEAIQEVLAGNKYLSKQLRTLGLNL
jgi:DNA-binding NarL/FixJ family response regulator